MMNFIDYDEFLLQERSALITPIAEMLDLDGSSVATGKVVKHRLLKRSYCVWDVRGEVIAQMEVRYRWFAPQVEVYDKDMHLCGSFRGKGFSLGGSCYHVYDAGGKEFCQIRGNIWGTKLQVLSMSGLEWGRMEQVNHYRFKEIFTIESRHHVTISQELKESSQRMTVMTALFVLDRMMQGKSI